MRIAIFAVLLAASACFADKDHHAKHDKRQIYGGLPYYGGFYGGGFYPGYYAGGVGVLPGAALLGRKRREAVDEDAELEHHDNKEKRHLFPGFGWGYPGYGYPGFGYPGYGYPGFGYPGFGYPFPGFITRKRRDTEDVESHEEHKEKRQIFPGYGGVGYGGLGYGYGGFGGYPGYGYGGLGYGAGFYGRKRRDTEDVESHEEHKEKRQIFPGYGGIGYGGLGYGGYGYGGYPGVVGVGYPAVGGFYGRKRRDVDDVSEHIKEKRQIGFGYPGYGYGGFGYGGLGYGGFGYGAVNTGFGYPAIYGRKRRDTEDVESHKDKRQVLLGGVGYPGFGYGGLGYGGLGYGYGAVNTGFGYPAIYGRKRRDTDDVEHHEHDEHHKEKRQILAGGLIGAPIGYGYGYPGYGVGLGYGAVNTGFGYPAIYGRKRRDTEDVEAHGPKEHKDKRQILAAGYAPFVGAPLIGAAPIVGAPLVGPAFVGGPFIGGYGYGVGPGVLL